MKRRQGGTKLGTAFYFYFSVKYGKHSSDNSHLVAPMSDVTVDC